MAGVPEDSLFFGTDTCYLSPVQGTSQVYTMETVRQAESKDLPQKKKEAVQRIHPLACLGDEYASLVVDAVPVADLETLSSSSGSEAWPQELQKPLLKTPSGPFQAVRSGIRSCLFPAAGKWYRLKGCGNNAEGFLVVPVKDDQGKIVVTNGHQLQKIRGASYRHTATLELHNSNHFASIFPGACANIPLGWYEYDIPLTPFPKVVRCCGIFQTLGDRRLSDHVLRGLELLLPYMAGPSPSICLSNGQPLTFPENPFGGARPGDEGFDEMQQTHMVIVGGGGLDCPTDLLCDISSSVLKGVCPPSIDAFVSLEIASALKALWTKNCQALKADTFGGSIDGGLGSLLGYLYWRFGWETGLVCRAMRGADMIWGTYQDMTGFHCNAHGNNMVLVQENTNQPERPFLLPLDFDMAYTKETCAFGGDSKDDTAKFQDYAEVESVSMARDLGGAPDSTGSKHDHKVPQSLEPLRWALRDTMVKAWFSAYRGDPDTHLPHDASRSNQAYALLKLALIVTADVVA